MRTASLLPACHHCGLTCGRTFATAGLHGASRFHCTREHMLLTLDATPLWADCRDCHAEPARVQGLCGWCLSERRAELEDQRAAERWL